MTEPTPLPEWKKGLRALSVLYKASPRDIEIIEEFLEEEKRKSYEEGYKAREEWHQEIEYD